MNVENIRSLAEILSAHGLTALEVAEGANRIRLEKAIFGANAAATPVAASGNELVEWENNPDDNSVNFNRLIEVKSPLVGVFYTAASPDSETFVSVGTKVKKGDVLCIIETMKLMNEVLAEQDGEIVDICLKNGDIAEYGQVLFKMF